MQHPRARTVRIALTIAVVALVSAGRGNRYGHPAPGVLSRLDLTKALGHADTADLAEIVTDTVSVALLPCASDW